VRNFSGIAKSSSLQIENMVNGEATKIRSETKQSYFGASNGLPVS